MARYTGPKTKVSRRHGILLGGSPRALEHKPYPPGQHGPKGSRRKISEYGTALAEKQKLRFQYGVLERQFRRYFETALKTRGITGLILLQLLDAPGLGILRAFPSPECGRAAGEELVAPPRQGAVGNAMTAAEDLGWLLLAQGGQHDLGALLWGVGAVLGHVVLDVRRMSAHLE